jgi:hypothetical protein
MIMDIKTMLNGHTDDPLKHAVGLSAVWQKCVSEPHKSECRLLMPKEHGQLGRLRKCLGMKQATEVVEYAIRNWDIFAQKAATEAGSNVFPEKPSVGWLYQYHAIAALMLYEDLKSIKKEQATQEAQAQEMPKPMPELKSKVPSLIPLQLTAEQLNAFCKIDDPANEAWADKVTEKYGPWRPANNGIPCVIELKKAD